MSHRHLGPLAVLAVLLAGGLGAAPAQAHQASTAYIDLSWQGSTVTERLDVALRDLDRDLPLDLDEDGQIRWGELRQAWPQIVALRDQHLQWGAEGNPCRRRADPAPQLARHADGAYAVLQSVWDCDAVVTAVQLRYDLFAQSDPDHRALLHSQGPAVEQTLPLVPGAASHGLGVAPGQPATASPWQGLARMVGQGVHHILIGSDHILFLLALLLPAVLSLKMRPAPLREVGGRVLKIVSAFTVAHSVTLALAAFQIVSPPSRWVESLIALSIVVAALSNLRRRGHLPGTALAFGFGLMHGFGFANALAELALQQGQLAANLLAFNIGVESGQLLIVVAVLPCLWLARRQARASAWVLRGGSATIGLMGAVWFTERALEVRILPL